MHSFLTQYSPASRAATEEMIKQFSDAHSLVATTNRKIIENINEFRPKIQTLMLDLMNYLIRRCQIKKNPQDIITRAQFVSDLTDALLKGKECQTLIAESWLAHKYIKKKFHRSGTSNEFYNLCKRHKEAIQRRITIPFGIKTTPVEEVKEVKEHKPSPIMPPFDGIETGKKGKEEESKLRPGF